MAAVKSCAATTWLYADSCLRRPSRNPESADSTGPANSGPTLIRRVLIAELDLLAMSLADSLLSRVSTVGRGTLSTDLQG